MLGRFRLFCKKENAKFTPFLCVCCQLEFSEFSLGIIHSSILLYVLKFSHFSQWFFTLSFSSLLNLSSEKKNFSRLRSEHNWILICHDFKWITAKLPRHEPTFFFVAFPKSEFSLFSELFSLPSRPHEFANFGFFFFCSCFFNFSPAKWTIQLCW